MTEERKHAILLATVILTTRRLQPLLEEDDRECNAELGYVILGGGLHQEVDGARGAHPGLD